MEKQTAVLQKKWRLNEGFKRELRSVLIGVLASVLLINFVPIAAFATEAPLTGFTELEMVIKWIAKWSGKIGLAVAFFGALQTALGFMQDDADAKVRGMKVMAAGFMVFGVTEVYTNFFTKA